MIRDGKVDFNYNGLMANRFGLWKLTGGKVTFADNGVVKAGNDWYNMSRSAVIKQETVANNQNGWWYCDANGKVDFSMNTVAKNQNGWWVIQNGKVNFGYNGLASNKFGTRKITNGKVTFRDNGVIKVGNDWYHVQGQCCC